MQDDDYNRASGGTQSEGGRTGNQENWGGKFYGGSVKQQSNASGGGGGYYGGASGSGNGAAGGGGSSFVSDILRRPEFFDGNSSMPSHYSYEERMIGNTGDGVCRITRYFYYFNQDFPRSYESYQADQNFDIELSFQTNDNIPFEFYQSFDEHYYGRNLENYHVYHEYYNNYNHHYRIHHHLPHDFPPGDYTITYLARSNELENYINHYTSNWYPIQYQINIKILPNNQLQLKNPLLDIYIPGSNITLDFTLLSHKIGDVVNITKQFEQEKIEYVLTHEVNGNLFEFSDNFKIPNVVKTYTVVYFVTDKDGIATSLPLRLQANRAPKIVAIEEMKDGYIAGEDSTIDIVMFDDSSLQLIMRDEKNEYWRGSFDCSKHFWNRTTISFKIPDYSFGSEHKVTIVAFDQFRISSNTICYSYKIVGTSHPDISLTTTNIPYTIAEGQYVYIRADIKSHTDSRVCMASTIDNSNFMYHDCFDLTAEQMQSFQGKIRIYQDRSYPIKTHTLRIFALDNKHRESNRILHQFSILEPDQCDIYCTVHIFYNEIIRLAFTAHFLSYHS